LVSGFLLINTMSRQIIDVGDLVALKDDPERSSGIGLVLRKDERERQSEDILDIISQAEMSGEVYEIDWREQVGIPEPMVLVLWSSSKQKSIAGAFENNSVNFWIPMSDVRVVSKA